MEPTLLHEAPRELRAPASSRNQGAANATPYGSYTEFLADYEAETVLRAEAHLCAVGHAPEAGARPVAVVRAELERVARERRARVAATASDHAGPEGALDLPLVRIGRRLGLTEIEERIVAYLLFVREGARLPALLDAFKVSRGERIKARTALAIATGSPDGCFAHRALLAAHGTLSRAALLCPIHLEQGESLLDVDLVLRLECVAGLLSDDATLSHLRRGVRVERPSERLDDVVLSPVTRETLDRVAAHHEAWLAARRSDAALGRSGYGTATVVLLDGLPGTGKTLAARALAGSMGRPLVLVDAVPTGRGYAQSADEMIAVALMEAGRLDAVLFLDEFDQLAGEPGSLQERQLLLALERATSIVLLATNRARGLTPAMERRILFKLHFELPDAPGRAELWRRHLDGRLAVDASAVRDLAERFWMSGGYIKNAVASARHAAVDGPPAAAIEALASAGAAQERRFEATFAEAVEIVPRAHAPSLPPCFEASTLPEIVRLLPALVAARPRSRLRTPRVGLLAPDLPSLVGAADYVAATLDRRLVLVRSEHDNGELSANEFFAELATLAAGAAGRFVALFLVGESPSIDTKELERHVQALRGGPLVALVGTTEPELVEQPAALGLIACARASRLVHGGAAASLARAVTGLGFEVGDVDWERIAGELTAAVGFGALGRLADAIARARGARAMETADLLAALALRGDGQSDRAIFGRPAPIGAAATRPRS